MRITMIKRLEQVAALVVAAGLAIVSYWLFFSWAQGWGPEHRQPRQRSHFPDPGSLQEVQPRHGRSGISEAAARLDQPLLGGRVIEAGDVRPHLLNADGQPLLLADRNDAGHGPGRILEGLPEEGLGQLDVFTDASVELGGIAGGHRFSEAAPTL